MISTFKDGRFRSTPGRIYGGLSVKIASVILNDKGIGREVYVLPILVEAKLVVKAMFLRRRMPETCRGRLII